METELCILSSLSDCRAPNATIPWIGLMGRDKVVRGRLTGVNKSFRRTAKTRRLRSGRGLTGEVARARSTNTAMASAGMNKIHSTSTSASASASTSA